MVLKATTTNWKNPKEDLSLYLWSKIMLLKSQAIILPALSSACMENGLTLIKSVTEDKDVSGYS